jgi:hypothetical protein
MHIITATVSPSEPCHGLFEGLQDDRWVQKVFVIRGDAIARYEVDMGPAEDFDGVTPILIPGFGDESVSAFQYLAEQNRHDDYWTKRAEEMLAESTLIADHVRQVEQFDSYIKNKSVFGPAVTTQRNIYDSSVVARKLSAAKQKHTGIVPQKGRQK